MYIYVSRSPAKEKEIIPRPRRPHRGSIDMHRAPSRPAVAIKALDTTSSIPEAKPAETAQALHAAAQRDHWRLTASCAANRRSAWQQPNPAAEGRGSNQAAAEGAAGAKARVLARQSAPACRPARTRETATRCKGHGSSSNCDASGDSTTAPPPHRRRPGAHAAPLSAASRPPPPPAPV